MYKKGEPVIYRLMKTSTRPGPRAQHVDPSPQGELYSYLVDKFWTVAEVMPDRRLRLQTRRGKEHVLSADDPNLRPARWWERLFYRDRFPQLDAAVEMPSPEAAPLTPRPKQRTA